MIRPPPVLRARPVCPPPCLCLLPTSPIPAPLPNYPLPKFLFYLTTFHISYSRALPYLDLKMSENRAQMGPRRKYREFALSILAAHSHGHPTYQLYKPLITPSSICTLWYLQGHQQRWKPNLCARLITLFFLYALEKINVLYCICICINSFQHKDKLFLI